MNLSIFLAKAWGLFLIIISLAFLINKKNLQTILQAYQSKWNVLVSGSINLVVGILMVLSHNIWTWNWKVIITLFGWVALIKGVVRLVWPSEVDQIRKLLVDSRWVSVLLIIALALGVYLTFIGFTSA